MDKDPSRDIAELKTSIAELKGRFEGFEKLWKNDLNWLKEKIRELVTKVEFNNVKVLVYGATSIILTAVLVAIIAQVVKR